MLFSSTLTVLAIAAQSLFIGVDAAALLKRQSAFPPSGSQDSGNPFDSIVQPLTSGFNGSIDQAGPFNVNATYGLGNQGGDPFGSIFSQLFPAAFNGLAGPGNNVSVTGVSGQPPSFIGLGFSPVNGTGAGGFDFISSFSQISGPFAEIISSILNGTSFSTFAIPSPGAGGAFPGGGFPTGQNSTFPGPNGATPPFQGFNGTTPSLPGLNGTVPTFPTATIPYPESMTALPIPTSNPTVLPFSIPSDVASSIEAELSSIALSLSGALPTNSFVPSFPTTVPVGPLPTSTDSVTT